MKKHLAEGAGAFILTLAYLLMQTNASMRQSAPATLGFLLFGLTLAVRNIALAHFNPAVAMAGWVAGRVARYELGGSLLAQGAGALIAGAIASWLLHSEQLHLPALYRFPQQPSLEVVFVELLGVALLVSAYWMLFSEKKEGEGEGMRAAGVGALFYAMLSLLEPFAAALNPAFLIGALVIGMQDGALVLTRLLGIALGTGLSASLLIAMEREK